jgi:hypothetical protein
MAQGPGLLEPEVIMADPPPVCFKCERPITRWPPPPVPKASGGAGANNKGATAALWRQQQQQQRRGPPASRDDEGEDEEDGMPLPPLPHMASSFVMVARMADMSMSFLHVQEAAAAAMLASSHNNNPSSSSQQRAAAAAAAAAAQGREQQKQAGLSGHLRRAETVLKYGTGQVRKRRRGWGWWVGWLVGVPGRRVG